MFGELTVKKCALFVIIVQSALGFLIMFYGMRYSIVDTKAAEEMLEFIRTSNPAYYQKLTDNRDSSYLRNYYQNYTTHGNRKIILIGLFFIAIGVNIAIPALYMVVREKMNEPGEVEPEEATEQEGQGEDQDF